MFFGYGNQNTSYAVMIDPTTSDTSYLAGIGFNPRICSSVGNTIVDKLAQTQCGGNTHNYVDSYLFTSDSMIGTQGKRNYVSIKLKEVGETVHVERIWVGSKGEQYEIKF